MTNHIENLILIGRPASGKSEFIDHLKKTEVDGRIEKYRIGNIVEIDDFPWFWERFVEDTMWEELGYKRLYSIKYPDGNMGLSLEHLELFDLWMKKFNYEIPKRFLKDPKFYDKNTLFIEFSRGGIDGYKKALPLLSDEILKKSVILYNKVSFAESMRKNNKRYEDKNKGSILKHKAATDIFEKYYNTCDWDNVSGGKDFGTLDIRGIKVPFVTVNNEPETTDPNELEKRYGPQLNKLYQAKYGK